ncbi:craniofacial development protein 2-like [Sinocyclocheilus rhinocerous]|uniref:craniofacial development protein 2-like n=1 Tax=Sinocyclocheilus rhinocerous TaxID=307959 RepID=UPI0007B80A37|nr:PREDICTED: craniofacial development protein 2-like [Sinocyclocheilus rhinocerous]
MKMFDQTHCGVQRLMTDTTFTAKRITRMGTWNIRTLHQSSRLNQLLKEFEQHRFDLLGISEVRWTGSGEMTSDGKKILYYCNDKKHIRGVGLVLGKQAIRALVGWKPVCDRIITARFASAHVRTTVIQVYAPTEETNDIEKEEFYDVLQAVIDEIPRHDLKIVIGDMNAQFSSDRQGFKDIIGPFTSSKRLSDNGERLLSYCTLVPKKKKAKKKQDQAQEVEDKETASRAYADLDRAVKQTCRRDKKDWLEKKCKEAQMAADRNDTRTLYRIIKDLSGAWRSSSVPIKDKNVQGKVSSTVLLRRLQAAVDKRLREEQAGFRKG